MTTTTQRRAAVGASVAAALLLGGCNDFLKVSNPNVIDVKAIDPVADAATLAGSVQQNFAVAYGWSIMYSSWLSGETLVSETFPTRNEFGRRDVPATNGSLSADVWAPLSLAAASSKIVLDLTLPNPTTNLNYARAALWRGYAFVLMAEEFCRGTVDNGPELSTAAMLDSAVANLTKAITIGNAEGSAAGKQIANTRARRPRARAAAGGRQGAGGRGRRPRAGRLQLQPAVHRRPRRTGRA